MGLGAGLLASATGAAAVLAPPAAAKDAGPNALQSEQIRRSEEVNQYLFLQAELLKAKGAGNPRSLAEIQAGLNASPQEQYFNLLDQTMVNGISYESGGPVNVYADSKEQVTIVYQSELSVNDYLQAGRTDPSANFYELVARDLYNKSLAWSGHEDWAKKDDPERKNGINKWALVERVRNQNGKDIKSYDVVLAPDP